ncbi:MAG: DNA/RNA non-specific endonuclease [Pyrinomonadaceae bacterium]
MGIFLLAATLLLTGCGPIKDRCNPPQQQANSNATSERPSVQPGLPPSVHLAFGNPSNATTDAANKDNFLVVGDGSAFSYNNSRGTINWISWKTTRADLGDSIPRPDFRPDPRLPANFLRIGYYDYSGNGYDRGHMVPSADRFADASLNEETFLMTNIVPQTGALNRYPWEKLESYSRSQARRGSDVYTIAGLYGNQGTLKQKVTVPTNCWKIIIFMPRGGTIESIGPRTRIIAVDMPNKDGIEYDSWEKYKTTIRSIEEKTGLDFFASMPAELQNTIETRMEIVSTKR